MNAFTQLLDYNSSHSLIVYG